MFGKRGENRVGTTKTIRVELINDWTAERQNLSRVVPLTVNDGAVVQDMLTQAGFRKGVHKLGECTVE